MNELGNNLTAAKCIVIVGLLLNGLKKKYIYIYIYIYICMYVCMYVYNIYVYFPTLPLKADAKIISTFHLLLLDFRCVDLWV